MQSIFLSIEVLLKAYAQNVPLELFVLVGSIIEELAAFIPSPLVLGTAGSIAAAQSRPALYLMVLAVLAATAKTAGEWLFFFFADKLEDIATGKAGKFFGITHKEVEGWGKRFSNTRSDTLLVFICRAIPVIPSAPVSIICGAVKINPLNFITATWLGMFVRSITFLYIGYTGFTTIESLAKSIDSIQTYIEIAIIIATVVGLGYLCIKRSKQKSPPPPNN